MTDAPNVSPYLLREPVTERDDKLVKAVMADRREGGNPVPDGIYRRNLRDHMFACLDAYRSKP